MREDWNHEIELALRAILFKLSVWDHNASYGAALQNLKYTDSRSAGPVHSNPTRWQKTLYGLLTVGGNYAWSKWDAWMIDQEGGYQEVCLPILFSAHSIERTHSDKLRTALPKNPPPLQNHPPSLNNSLHRRLHLLPRLPLKRTLPHANRPHPAHAPRAPINPSLPRSLL